MTTAADSPQPEPIVPDAVIPIAEIEEMDQDDLYAAVMVLEKEFGVKVRDSEFLEVSDLRKAVLEAAKSEKALDTRRRKEEIERAKTPTIYIEPDIPSLTEEALAAIRKANLDRPEVFARSGEMVALHYDEERRRVILKTVDKETLRGILMRCAHWIRTKVNKDGSIDEAQVTPPGFVLDDVLSLSPHLWRLPVVKGVVEVPILRPDGSVWAVPGYDEVTRLIYNPAEDLAGFRVPEQPTPNEVLEAVVLLSEVFHDFPFLGERDLDIAGQAKAADRANAIAALVTHIARPLIDGPVPAYLVDKPQPRTGASLLQELMYVILTGQAPTMKPTPETPEEWRKYITGELAAGTSIILMDNVEQKLRAPSLASIITAPAWRDRKMGSNTIVTYENRLFWLLNGNNVQMSPDMAPRCFYSRLDAKMARPGEREGFKHPDIRRWVRENRVRLLEAIYTLIRSWIVAGRPGPERPPKLGTFEMWVAVVGGVLHHAGIPGFMANQGALYDAADQGAAQWDSFLQAIRQTFRGSFTVAELVDAIEREEKLDGERVLSSALPEGLEDGRSRGGRSFRMKIGKAFTRQRDVVFPSGVVLKKSGVAHGGVVAWVVRTGSEAVTSQTDLSGYKGGGDGGDGGFTPFTPCEKPKRGTNTIEGETTPPQPPSPPVSTPLIDRFRRRGINYVPDLSEYRRIKGVKVGRCITRGCPLSKMWEDENGQNFLCGDCYDLYKEWIEEAGHL